MSSGKISEDGKTVSFEINNNRVVGNFILHHMDGDESNPDRIVMRMETRSAFSVGAESSSQNSVIIDKSKTKVLSHIFRHMADVMDEWYKEEE